MTSAVRRARFIVLAGLVAVAALGSSGSPVAAAVTYSRSTPIVLQEVPVWDLEANKNGICKAGANLIIKTTHDTFNATNYLNVAAKCGLKVIFSIHNIANYSTGVVYPSRVAAWVNKVKNHPATWGYLSVKEPSWSRITAPEIRSLYAAFKKADPNHPVMALFGDTPNFGSPANPYGSGMANVVMVNWYPVETTNGTNTTYLTGASRNFPKVKAHVAKWTPGVPIWLMVQTHKYLRPATHKKQRPTQALLSRQVREGFAYLGAKGIAFHTWKNGNYNVDQLRDPQMVSWIKSLGVSIRAGTFQ